MIERRGSCTWRTIVGAILLTMGPVVASVTAASLLGGPPKNDLCENAISVSVPGSVVGFTIDATIDDTFPFCGTSITAPGVWYSVIGTGNTITATTCSEFTEYDTKISVYCNSCAEPICVGGNDDDCVPFGLLSTVQWCSQEGTEYLILVHGFGGQTGGFVLSIFDDGVACDDPVDCAFGDVCGDPDAGNCFDPDGNGTPGCNDLACCEAVCALDPFCCDVEWDSLCAGEAADLCGNPACPGEGSCFEDNGTPGCDDPVCCNKICTVDPFCCDVEWDQLCADAAADLCGLPPVNDLCEDAIPVSVPGFAVGFTNDATIDDEFPFCGTSITAPGIWYSVVGTGNTMTATTCSEFTEYNTKISVYCSCLDPICVGGNDDDCDMFGGLHSTVTWCSQAGAEYLILVHGFGDLTGGFDLSVFDDGVACGDPVDCLGGGACGDPDAGSCFVVHPTPFCDNAECCELVCAIDPFCCDTAWDGQCVDEAQVLCAGCGDPDSGSCFENNGTPGCDNAECCALVCDADPFCCESFWDAICAGAADDLCEALSPKNDLCEDAIPVPVFGSVVGTTNAATIDDAFPFCGTSITAPGVWYSVIGTGNTMTATTCSEFTEYNTKISVYCMSCAEPTCVDGNDDDCDLFGGLHSTVTWCSQEGAVYLILVHGSGDLTGGFHLAVFDDGVECAGLVDCLRPDPCPADFDTSGDVGVKDLLFLLGAWGPCPKKGDCLADLVVDGVVGVKDLLFLLGAWGPCPGGAECKGQQCGTYTFDCNPDDDTCVCYTNPDGSGFCGEVIPCDGAIPCDGDGDCPPGFRCAILTCCGDAGICIPECDGIPSANAPKGQRTSAGR